MVVSLTSAEIPRHRVQVIRQTAPYISRGFAPSSLLNLPLRATAPPPAAYGPAPPEGDAPTTAETPTSTERLAENLENLDDTVEEKPQKPEKVEQIEPNNGQQFYLILPQQQQQQQQQEFVYTVPKSAALVRVGGLVATAVPLQATVQSGVYTPWSSSYIEIYQ